MELKVWKADRSITQARIRAMPIKHVAFPFRIMDAVGKLIESGGQWAGREPLIVSFAALIYAAEEWRVSVKEAFAHCENSFKKAGLLEKEQENLDAHKKEMDGQCSLVAIL